MEILGYIINNLASLFLSYFHWWGIIQKRYTTLILSIRFVHLLPLAFKVGAPGIGARWVPCPSVHVRGRQLGWEIKLEGHSRRHAGSLV